MNTATAPGTIHAFDCLQATIAGWPNGLCPVFGSERFLKRLVVQHLAKQMAQGDADWMPVEMDGAQARWADVMDELATRTLFGGDGAKLVVMEDADTFVKQHREALESLQEHPPAEGWLVLLVDSWPGNTRLYKCCHQSGVQINCNPPTHPGRSKKRDDARIAQWLIERAETEYGFSLPKLGPPILIELTQCHFGQMDVELAKLGLYAIDEPLDAKRIREIVGGWPSQTMWQAIDAATEGEAGKAMELLHRFLQSGEHPLALFGQISWSLRRYAEVGERVRRDVRNRRRIDLTQTLKDSGFQSWSGELAGAERRLKQLGRDRVDQIYHWLLETESALKRTHSADDRARFMLEKLFLKMAKPLGPRRAT